MFSSSERFETAVRYWWTYLIGGIFLLLLGIWILTNPAAGYAGLTTYFAVAILISGLTGTAFAVNNRDRLAGWGWYLFSGIVDLVIGTYLLAYPDVAAVALPIYIGFWLLFRSMLAIRTATALRSIGQKGWGWLLGIGLVALAMAIAILLVPGLGVVAALSFTSLALIALGISSVLISLRLRRIHERIEEHREHHP